MNEHEQKAPEIAMTAETERSVLRFFPTGERFVITAKSFTDWRGSYRPERNMTLRVEDCRASSSRKQIAELFRWIADDIERDVEVLS